MLVLWLLVLSIATVASGSPIDKNPLKQNCKGPNEIRVRCGVFCPSTCSGSEAAQQCLAACVPNVCQCLPGYLREDISHKCVLPCDCPKYKKKDVK